ncbi:hypothetical protein SCLCIDRAFT_1222856 [Scleroderma citrinum Foug A]|uniref:Uncharacterized protein n=1 Tax=Scleroderma citrinum Foug A TaxID=1036808 RepID=A0A0C2ZKY5_9AGAM|nr:hypothetical protein SCLCIDRAFT_1222856 [Scleroderma citrinum Foug A]
MHLHNPIRHSTLTAYKHNRYFQTRRGYINWYLSFLGIRSQRNILIEQQVHPNLQIQRFVMAHREVSNYLNVFIVLAFGTSTTA